MRGARRLVDALRFKQPAKKALGQHFLVHDDVLEHTVEWAEVDVEDHVLEVGPGPGVLTEVLLEKGCKVTAVELDAGACEHLRSVFASELDEGRLVLIEGDALTVRWPNDISRLVANIPYQISSPLIDAITDTIETQQQPRFGTSWFWSRRNSLNAWSWNTKATWVRWAWSWPWILTLTLVVASLRTFSPMPKVHSRLLRMTPHDEEWPCDRRLLVQMIRTAFERRKKLKKTLQKPPRRLGRVPGWHATRWKRAYRSMEHDPRLQRRPETLELDEWAELGADFSSCEEEA